MLLEQDPDMLNYR